MESRSEDQRKTKALAPGLDVDDDAGVLADRLGTYLHIPHADAGPSVRRFGAPWVEDQDWIRNESFVHSLDQFDDAGHGIAPGSFEEYDNDDDDVFDDSLGDADGPRPHRYDTSAERNNHGAEELHADEQVRSPVPLLVRRTRDDGSASSEFFTTQDTELRSGSLRGESTPMSPNTEASALLSTSSHDGHYDSFFDASSASPELGRASHDNGITEEEETASSPDPTRDTITSPHSMMSSSTLRNDVGTSKQQIGRHHELHHQDSVATLMAADDPGHHSWSQSGVSRATQSPERPVPNAPLPSPPADSHEMVDPSASLTASSSSFSSRAASNSSAASSAQSPPRPTAPKASPQSSLGPSGTIRGRPRGATIGGMPGAQAVIRMRTRPRSLLSHEITQDELAAAASTFGARSGEKSRQIDGASWSHDGIASGSHPSSGPSFTVSLPAEVLQSTPMLKDPSSSSTNMMSSSPASFAGANGAAPSSSKSQTSGGGRSRSGSNTSLLHQVQRRTRQRANFIIAVVGHVKAGKSTVIKKGLRQFGLSKPQVVSDKITSHSTVCIVDQEQRTIEVLEVDASVLLLGTNKRFGWPKFLPRIDAAILCYDASEESSFIGMAELLENFALNDISTVMLACKSEKSPKEVDPYYVSDMASVYNVGLAECSVQSEEGKKRMRDCFSYLVKEVAKARAMRMPAEDQGEEDREAQNENLTDAMPRDAAARIEATSISSAGMKSPQKLSFADRKVSDSTQGSGDTGETGETAEVGSDEEDVLQQSIDRAQLGLQSAKSAGGYVSIEELYDKFFFAAVSGNDERFLLMFMTFYRGFARPIELLRQIVSRFDALARGEHADGIMIRYSLMKLITMLGDWMHEFPGDLSDPESHATLRVFFDRVMKHSSTKHIAAPMLPLMEALRRAPDLDAAWSKIQDNDKPTSVAAVVPPVVAAASRGRSSSTASSAPEQKAGSSPKHAEPTEVVATAAPEAPTLESVGVLGRERSSSDATQSSDHGSSVGSASISAGSGHDGSMFPSQRGTGPSIPPISPTTSTLHHQEYERKVALRNVSNALFDIKEEAIAHELTRIEWEIFSTIGPRDLLRHILVSREVRSQDSPVAQSIAHFNYVSGWVGSMILSQSKTKQRARMLEKFIAIASILRRTNNYNTLHAILAGLGNSAIHRLKHTNELLNGKRIYKTYQSLTRLMGSDRSFAAYRLALENSEGRTIPYLGVHLQDILSTSDGNPSKRKSDGMIHWRKFSLMHDAVMAIVRCQEYETALQPNASISKLVLNLPIMSEDTMYQRSLQVEPRQVMPGTSAAGSRIMRTLFHAET